MKLVSGKANVQSEDCYSFVPAEVIDIKSDFDQFDSGQTKNFITSVHGDKDQLVFSDALGYYHLYDVNQFENMDYKHSVSISAYPVDVVRITSSYLITCLSSTENSLKIFNHQSESIERVDANQFAPQTMAVSPDSRLVAIAGLSGQIAIIDSSSNDVVQQFSVPGAVNSMQFFPNSKAIAAATEQGVICYDLNRKVIFRRFQEEFQFNLVTVEPSGEIIAAADRDFHVILLDAQTGKIIDDIQQHQAVITALKFDPTGTGDLYSASWDKTIKCLECFQPGKPNHTIEELFEVLALDFSLDGKVICSLSNGCINIYEFEEDRQTESFNFSKIAVAPRRQWRGDDKFFAELNCTDLASSGSTVAMTGKGAYLCFAKLFNDGLEFDYRLQYSINMDFKNIERVSNTRAGLNNEDHYKSESKDQKVLKDIAYKQNVTNKRVLDPIQVLQNEKRELFISKIHMSKDGSQLFCLTQIGVLVFSKNSFNYQQMTVNLDVPVLNKKLELLNQSFDFQVLNTVILGSVQLDLSDQMSKCLELMYKQQQSVQTCLVNWSDDVRIRSGLLILNVLYSSQKNNDYFSFILRQLFMVIKSVNFKQLRLVDRILHSEYLQFVNLVSQSVRQTGDFQQFAKECLQRQLALTDDLVSCENYEDQVVEIQKQRRIGRGWKE